MSYLVIISVEVFSKSSWLESNSLIFLTGVELEDLRNHSFQPESLIKEATVEAPGSQEW